MKIKIANFRETPDSDNILAVCDIQLTDLGITICGIKIINGKFGEFVALPNYPEKVGDKTSWLPVVQMPEALTKECNAAVLSAYRQAANYSQQATQFELEDIPF